MVQYFDKNGKEIKAGMTIKHDDGDIELIYPCDNGKDLGINASNELYLEKHDTIRQIYVLSQFRLSEWEVIE